MNKEKIQKIECVGNKRTITTNQAKYFLKKQKKYDQENVYTILEERGFAHFLKPITTLASKEEVFPFIEEKHYHSQEKAIDMMHVLSLLQNKTTFYQEISLDEIKKIYEETKKEILYLYDYYQDLEERSFKEVYPSPSVLLFQKNITLLFESLAYANEMLEKWYEEINRKKRYRKVLVHHKFILPHLLEADIPRLISLDELEYGLPIEDFITFFKKHCLEQDMESLFAIYQQKFPFTKEEYLLFSSQLTLPPKLDIFKTSLASCCFLSKEFQKMEEIRTFFLQQNQKHQKDYH